MTKFNYSSFNNEDGTTYDFEKFTPRSLKAQNDKTDQIINRSGYFSLIEEMTNNEPIVGASRNLIESFVCTEKMFMKPVDTSDEAKYYSDLVWGMFDDLEKPFIESIKDFLTCIEYGFSLSEIVMKKRLGYHPENPKKNSKYNDGLYAPRKFAPRPQKTIMRWFYDDFGRIQYVRQNNPTNFKNVDLKYDKLLHFKVKSYNDDPEGTSIYRNIALTYYAKRKIKRTQQIRFERGFDGIPVIELPIEWCDANDSEHIGIRTWAENTVRNVRQAQDAGIVMPRVISAKDQKPLISFSIISGDASQGQNAEEMLDRCDREMATSLLSDFFLSGKTASVSGSLGQIKVEVFATFVLMFLNAIVNEINNKLIPLIFEMNNWDKKYLPKLTHTNLSKLNMVNIMLFLQSIGKTRLMAKSVERDNALNQFVFGGLVPDISPEDWEKDMVRDETSIRDNTNTNINEDTGSTTADTFKSPSTDKSKGK